MKVVFASISSVTFIPIIRFLIKHFQSESQVVVIESYIKGVNAYFRNDNGVIFKKIATYENTSQFLNSIKKKSFNRYFNLIKALIKNISSNEKTLFYVIDHQSLFLLLVLKKLFNKTGLGIIYHQFELIEEKKLSRLSKKMFRFVCERANEVDLFVFPEINRMEYFKGLISELDINSFILPNTCQVQFDDFKNNHLRNDLMIDANDCICLHVGSIGGENHYFDQFIEIIEKVCKVRSDIHFVFVGRLTEVVQKKIENYEIQNLHTIPFVPHEELCKLYSDVDLGIILYKGPGLNYEYCAPNKLYEFWSYGIPVLGHSLKGLKPVFVSSLQGHLLNFDKQEEVVDYLINYKINIQKKKELKEFFKANYEIGNYLDRLESIIIEKGIYETK